jgi:hypothetical protein
MEKVEWIVIASRMGNPHAYHLNLKGMVRRQRLNGNWCVMKNMLKIQSDFCGNTKEQSMGGLNMLGPNSILQIKNASICYIANATLLLAGKPLEPFIPRLSVKTTTGREKNSGMVKIERIGQSACLLSKPKGMIGRQRLNGCGLASKTIRASLRYSPF